MDSLSCAMATGPAIGGLAGNFMLDGATYAQGMNLGYAGLDFYAVGRGGVLGEVDGETVANRFYFFNPSMVVAQWNAGLAVQPPAAASEAFLECGRQWAETHLGDDLDWETLDGLLTKVIADTDAGDAVLFAAWRDVAVPEGANAKARCLQRFHVLRELRNERHIDAVAEVGLTGAEALAVTAPSLAGLFGWTDGLPEATEAHRQARAEAEVKTNEAMAPSFEGLGESERDILVELAQGALASIH